MSEIFNKWSLFIFFFITYFIVMSGVIYDIINDPPALGVQVFDERTKKPKIQAVKMGRISEQFVFEGLLGGLFFVLK
jgi:hypothetical protein